MSDYEYQFESERSPSRWPLLRIDIGHRRATRFARMAVTRSLVGQPTTEVVEQLGSAFYDCADGRQLHWNDDGWGYADDVWQGHAREDGQLIPPQADIDNCRP